VSGDNKKPLAAPLVGIILFLLAFPLLWWNEGTAVKDYTTIGELNAKTLDANPDKVDSNKDGAPIHVTAEADTKDKLTDERFGVEAIALRMIRDVEMYQWEEDRPTKKEKEEGKQTTYKKVWSDSAISSENFEQADGHANPEMLYGSKEWIVDSAEFGAYTLPKSFIERLRKYEPVNIPADESLVPGTKTIGSGYYIGEDPNQPAIGDVRVHYRAVYPQEVSLIAQQKGSTFVPFKSQKTGRSWVSIRVGNYDKDELIAFERGQVKTRTWILRAVGFIFMFIGLMMVIKPISAFADRIPVLGDIVGGGLTVLNFLLAASLSLVVILLAWIAHRPLLAIGLGVLVAGLVFLMMKLVAARQKKKA